MNMLKSFLFFLVVLFTDTVVAENEDIEAEIAAEETVDTRRELEDVNEMREEMRIRGFGGGVGL